MFFWINFLIWNLGIFWVGLFFALALEPRWDRIPRFAYAAGYSLLVCPVAYLKISNPLVAAFYWVAFFSLLLYALAAFRDKLWKRTIVFLLMVAGSEISEFIVYYILDAMKISYDPSMNSLQMMLAVACETLVLIIILWFLLLVWNRIVSRRTVFHHSYLFLIFPASQIAMLFAFNRYSTETVVQNNTFASIGAFLGLIADFILLYVLMAQGQKAVLEQELRELETLHRLEEVHYQAIEARREETAKIRHDFNNQLATAFNLMRAGKDEKAGELLEELRADIAGTKEYAYCANAVVNAVLTEKAMECEKNGIKLKTEIELSEEPSVQAVHLCSVFSNLCDNAIRAAKECPQGQRFLSIRAARKGDYLHVKVENSSPDPKTKARAARKAYGQEILKDIASRYEGALTCGWEDGIYSAMVSLTAQSPV